MQGMCGLLFTYDEQWRSWRLTGGMQGFLLAALKCDLQGQGDLLKRWSQRLIPQCFSSLQDEHPALPENVTEDMQGFLLECFQKDPQRRPGAKALLRHAWLRQQRATLRSTWSNTVKARGGRTDAHASVTNVVERILQVGSRCQTTLPCRSHEGLNCLCPIRVL